MSKQITKIPLTQIERIQVYLNPAKKTLAQIKAATGADYIINGSIYNADWTPCCDLKADGATIKDDQYTYWGYGWDTGPDIAMMIDHSKVRNYICYADMITAYGPSNMTRFDSDKGVGGVRGRTAMGLTDSELVLYCSKDSSANAKLPSALRDEMAALGCKSAVMLDGGGSSMCDFLGQRIISEGTDGRKVHHLVLVYLKKEEPCDMDCREKLVVTALAELGTSAPTGDDKYIRWYNQAMGSNFALNVAWCAIFVSWCARTAGVCGPLIPNYAGCTTAMATFKKLGTWRDRSGYIPRRGDLIFFDWDASPAMSEHTGIVTGVSNGYVHTVEGNTSSGKVAEKSYALTSSLILGYVNWDASDAQTVPPASGGTGSTGNTIKDIQQGLNTKYSAGLVVDGSFGPTSRLAMVKAIQTEINRSCGGKLVVDGSFGPASKAACPALAKGNTGNLVWLLQAALMVKGYAMTLDSSFGPATETAVISYKATVSLGYSGTADGNVFAALLK